MAAIENEKIYGLKIRESANDGSDFSNPDVDYRIAFLGEDGLWHVKDSAGAVTSPYSTSQTFVGCKAYSAVTQSISDATTTAVAFELEEYDSDAYHSLVTNNTRFTVPAGKAGKYSLKGMVAIAIDASPVVAQTWWRVNGTTTVRGTSSTYVPSAAQILQTPSVGDVVLAVGDYVELMVYQDSSAARNIGHASDPGLQSVGAIALIGT